MNSTQVSELPLNNRNFTQLAGLVPGVVSNLPDEVGLGLTNVVSISMAGNRRNGVNWLVDGVSNVDVGSNITLLATPTIDSIEEFKIITTGYNAEWPRSGGGIVNIVTKSGSNQFRASGYEFFRNDALNANSWVRNQSTDPVTANNPAELDYNNFGYTLGGPVVKDNVFFFWSQEWRQISRAPLLRPPPRSILCGSPIPPTRTTSHRLTATRMQWHCWACGRPRMSAPTASRRRGRTTRTLARKSCGWTGRPMTGGG